MLKACAGRQARLLSVGASNRHMCCTTTDSSNALSGTRQSTDCLGAVRQVDDVQVYAEVMDSVQTLDAGRRSMYDPDELEEEQRERELRSKVQGTSSFAQKLVWRLVEGPLHKLLSWGRRSMYDPDEVE